MEDALQGTVTRLLGELRNGDRGSFDRLFPLVYDELHALARRALRPEAGRDPTLDATSLVHEAYLKLVDQSRADWRSRGHFRAVAAKAMRHITIDHARRRMAEKRGGGVRAVPLSSVQGGVAAAGGPDPETLLALDEALEGLAAEDERMARIVELKFFGAMTIEEIADVLEISPATVKRGWAFAQAWLHRAISGGAAEGPAGEAAPP
ncbi:MAG TPA: sigma-70 family RNA polymerase sigma factor [Gemmatimonadota bacterium]|nr:sigma-70 family RNA polymerase sigma factor [Gemmatimonadota bacterium]